jgi:hypothetical protein
MSLLKENKDSFPLHEIKIQEKVNRGYNTYNRRKYHKKLPVQLPLS